VTRPLSHNYAPTKRTNSIEAAYHKPGNRFKNNLSPPCGGVAYIWSNV